MQPQGHFGQFYGHGVEVNAVDAAFQDEAPDDGAVGQVFGGHFPVAGGGMATQFGADVGYASEQGRGIRRVLGQAGRQFRGVAGQAVNGVGEIIQGGDQKMAAAHSGIQDFEPQAGFRGVGIFQFLAARRIRAGVRGQRLRQLLKGVGALLDQRIQGLRDDKAHQFGRGVVAAGVFAGVGLELGTDAAGVNDGAAFQQALVQSSQLAHGQVAEID